MGGYYWKRVFLLTFGVAVLATGVALVAYDISRSWVVSGTLALLFAVGGASFVAGWADTPLRRLLTGIAPPGEVRDLSADPWQQMEAYLAGERHENLRRFAQAASEVTQARAVLDAMADGVIVADARARVSLLNAAAASMLGIGQDQAYHRTVIECTMNAALDAAVHAALTSGRLETVDLDIGYPRARKVRALVSASGSGGNRAAVVMLHDLTETVRLDEMRRDFVANVGHELRTPVTGIQTLAESLLNGALDDPAATRGFVDHILESSQRLGALVDDLLNLARAEAGAPQEPEPVEIGPIARAAVAAMDPSITEKRLDVGVEAPDNLCVLADPESVRQIIGNLLSNAVKYTPDAGSVEVLCRREGSQAVIVVSDTGIGIPLEDQERVFERFYRVDRHRSREAGGTGLGLSIVRHLVERLGGSVTLESAPGRGATFTVRLPAVPR